MWRRVLRCGMTPVSQSLTVEGCVVVLIRLIPQAASVIAAAALRMEPARATASAMSTASGPACAGVGPSGGGSESSLISALAVRASGIAKHNEARRCGGPRETSLDAMTWQVEQRSRAGRIVRCTRLGRIDAEIVAPGATATVGGEFLRGGWSDEP
jgi:hypothetical protein